MISPCQYHTKCRENSVKNLNTNVEVLIIRNEYKQLHLKNFSLQKDTIYVPGLYAGLILIKDVI